VKENSLDSTQEKPKHKHRPEKVIEQKSKKEESKPKYEVPKLKHETKTTPQKEHKKK
jgi:hypothetical protein